MDRPVGKLLALGFYGFCLTPKDKPNDGFGIGRVVREIGTDGDFGPIYFIRYNRHAGWDEKNTQFLHQFIGNGWRGAVIS